VTFEEQRADFFNRLKASGVTFDDLMVAIDAGAIPVLKQRDVDLFKFMCENSGDSGPRAITLILKQTLVSVQGQKREHEAKKMGVTGVAVRQLDVPE